MHRRFVPRWVCAVGVRRGSSGWLATQLGARGGKPARNTEGDKKEAGVFIIAVHRAFVLGLGARHRGIVDLSEGVIRCVTVLVACYYSSSSSSWKVIVISDQVIRENPASRGTETSAEVLVGPPGRMVSNASQQQWYEGGHPLQTAAQGPLPPPGDSTPARPSPSASSVGVGRHRGSTWVRQFSPP